MPRSKFRYVSKDEAFDAICFLETFEPQNEFEANDIEVAIIGLQKIIQRRNYYDSKKDEMNAQYRERMRTDPEFREHIRQKHQRYEEKRKEQRRLKRLERTV